MTEIEEISYDINMVSATNLVNEWNCLNGKENLINLSERSFLYFIAIIIKCRAIIALVISVNQMKRNKRMFRV